MSIYSFSAKKINGEAVSLSEYKDQVLLIVNTASRCGFTPQYAELQQLYEKYHRQGFEILAFPCNQFMHQEPGNEEEIQEFCQTNYGVTFPLFAKIDVRGKDAHPLFKYLMEQAPGTFSKQIKWNFTKFLINRKGEVTARFAPSTSPAKLETDVQNLLAD
ncbi:MAG: glutathione peroxidase [Tuberibacillus sp.]